MILFVVLLLTVLLWLVYFLLPPPLGLPILMYHKVSQQENNQLTISTDRLDEQFQCLKRLGYEPISFAELREFTQNRRPLPQKPVLLTFDDGYQTVYDLAYPLLKKHQFKATVFVPTRYLGGFNDWDGGRDAILHPETIRQISGDLIEVGLHSHNHESFKTYSSSQIADDLAECIRTLENQQCRYAPVFAYPYGALPAKRERRRAMKQAFQKEGITFAVRIGSRVNHFPLSDVYELRRIGINGTDSMRQFKTKLKRGRTKPF